MNYGIILGGGRGKRMESLTVTYPKVLLKYHGKPLLDYAVECLREAGIESIYAVVGYRADLICEYLDRKGVHSIRGDSNEHVFYAIWRGATGTGGGIDTLVFLDGDTIYGQRSIAGVSPNHWVDCDGVVIATTDCNSGSQWLMTVSNGVLTDIGRGNTEIARVGVIIQRRVANAVFGYANKIQLMSSWRMENEFLQGFETYQLGWGLFLRIAINVGCRLKVIMIPSEIKNINQPRDLE